METVIVSFVIGFVLGYVAHSQFGSDELSKLWAWIKSKTKIG